MLGFVRHILKIYPFFGSWIVDEHNRKPQLSDTGAVIG